MEFINDLIIDLMILKQQLDKSSQKSYKLLDSIIDLIENNQIFDLIILKHSFDEFYQNQVNKSMIILKQSIVDLISNI